MYFKDIPEFREAEEGTRSDVRVPIEVDAEQERELDATVMAWHACWDYLADRSVADGIMVPSKWILEETYSEARDKFGLPDWLFHKLCELMPQVARETGTMRGDVARIECPYDGYLVGCAGNPMSAVSYPAKGLMSLPTMNGNISVRRPRKMPGTDGGKWDMEDVAVKHDDGGWSVTFLRRAHVPDGDVTLAPMIVGVDVGLNYLAVANDSRGRTSFFDGGPIIAALKEHQRNLDILRNDGRLDDMTRLIVDSIEDGHITDASRDVAKQLSEMYPRGTLFVLEQLQGGTMSDGVNGSHTDGAMGIWSLHQFGANLCAMAVSRGQSVIFVPSDFTSQSCPACGHTSRRNRDKENHTFTCQACGYTDNDDKVAAINLRLAGREFVRQRMVSVLSSRDPGDAREQAALGNRPARELTDPVMPEPVGGTGGSVTGPEADEDPSEEATSASEALEGDPRLSDAHGMGNHDIGAQSVGTEADGKPPAGTHGAETAGDIPGNACDTSDEESCGDGEEPARVRKRDRKHHKARPEAASGDVDGAPSDGGAAEADGADVPADGTDDAGTVQIPDDHEPLVALVMHGTSMDAISHVVCEPAAMPYEGALAGMFPDGSTFEEADDAGSYARRMSRSRGRWRAARHHTAVLVPADSAYLNDPDVDKLDVLFRI